MWYPSGGWEGCGILLGVGGVWYPSGGGRGVVSWGWEGCGILGMGGVWYPSGDGRGVVVSYFTPLSLPCHPHTTLLPFLHTLTTFPGCLPSLFSPSTCGSLSHRHKGKAMGRCKGEQQCGGRTCYLMHRSGGSNSSTLTQCTSRGCPHTICDILVM